MLVLALGCGDKDTEGVSSDECADGLDNDEDGRIDYPTDPGCLASGDGDEADPEVAPACANGLDDDEDGVADFPNDDGCRSAADESEWGPAGVECANGRDDDGDGLTDYPNDPGCSARGDEREVSAGLAPACGDRADNDRDGLVDYPFDPGCVAAGDPDEGDPAEAPGCANGVDDDEDGAIDFPVDPGCIAASDGDEADPVEPPACSNDVDDDRDRAQDWPADQECHSAGDDDERGPVYKQCVDGQDNDEDGAIDFADPGCAGPNDNNENDPNQPAACADGEDNDDDGAIDWPADLGCSAHGSRCEGEGTTWCGNECANLSEDNEHCGACGNRCPRSMACDAGFCGGVACGVLGDAIVVPIEGGIFDVSTQGRPDTGSECPESGGSQVAFAVWLPSRYRLEASVESADFDTYLQLRTACANPAAPVECDDDGGPGNQARIRRDLDRGAYFMILDGFQGESGTARIEFDLDPR